jgi:hypothetical protein
MKKSDHSFNRLLRTAAGFSPAVADEEPPFGFVTRVVAAWKGAPARESNGLDALWFRRAFLCALGVMLLSVGLSFKTDTTAAAPNEDLAIAGYDATADLP